MPHPDATVLHAPGANPRSRPVDADTTETAPSRRRQTLSPVELTPSLVLAFTDGGRRPPARCALPPDGVVLGRALAFFDGGPLCDARMSRIHAEIRPAGSTFLIRDLGSHNGLRVDGVRVQEAELSPGSVIRLGDTILVFAPARAPEAPDPDVIGDSAPMIAVRRAIRLIAPKPHAVLLFGETGTGKEVVARALHRQRARPGRFIAVNCAALAEGVLESELFGHVRGAFTGAQQEREGLFRAADKGTLLLDEIGEMPPALQGKLLRAVETGRVRPVGAAHEVAVDVRVAAATHRDLPAHVRERRFRADLYARLAQWTFKLPPLRERRDDIPLIMANLLEQLEAGARGMDIELAEALLLHPWPLNVRGLRNALSIAVLACPGDAPLSLCPEVEAALAAERALTSTAPPPPEPPDATRSSSDRLPTQEALTEALERSRGSVAQTARLLRSSRQQIYRWAKSYGLDVEQFRDSR